ncbi:MAG: hypothetical protein HOB49_17250 [Gemmatimonadetes bacterium]|nr:hypothetical protein [Gemmatimonadota bacterium]
MQPINALAFAEGGVYAATAGGVLQYDPVAESYQPFTRADGMEANLVLSVCPDSSGNLWFGTDGDGLRQLRLADAQFVPTQDALRDLRINSILSLEDRLFVGTDVGVSVYLTANSRVKETYRQLGQFQKNTEVRAMVVYAGNLFVATRDGVAHATLASTNLQDPDSWTSSRLMGDSSSLIVHNDTLYCGGAFAVWRFDESQSRWRSIAFFGKVDGLSSFGQPRRLVASADGDLHERHGAGSWGELDVPHAVQSLAPSGEDLWYGTPTGLATLGRTDPPAFADAPSNELFDIEAGENGELWVASTASDREGDPVGGFRYDGDSWEVYGRDGGLPSDFAVGIARDESEHLWVTTWGRGVAILDDGAWRAFDQRNSALRGITQPSVPDFVVVSDIQPDAQGHMWMTNVQAGLVVMDSFPTTRSFLHDLDALGLPAATHLSRVAIGPDGTKWVATATEGFVFFDDGSEPFAAGATSAVVNPTTESRLRSANVTAIAVSTANVLWVGTDNGLYRLTWSYNTGTGRLSFPTWREYRLEDGLNSNFITSITFDDQGNVWVGTRAGRTWLRTTGTLVTTFTTQNSGLIHNRVASVTYGESDGSLWIGTFGGLGQLQVGLSRVESAQSNGPLVYPNPLVVDGSGSSRLTFARLPLDSEVTLFSLDGNLVRFLEAERGATVIAWDGTDRDGKTVGPGIYLYIAATRDGRTLRGKFAVVRAR